MRHAFLIIAHNEFEILKRLINQLDSEECDIYVHIDKKVQVLPELHTSKSRLFIIPDRIDVRWGNVSQIKCEYALWEAALANGPYVFYHLISGTHFPLVPLKKILSRYESMSSKNIVPDLHPFEGYQCDLKVRHYNLFTRSYSYGSPCVKRFSQLLWHICNRLQDLFKIGLNRDRVFYKGSNWVSLDHEAVSYMIVRKQDVLKRYRFSFCGDEIFVPSTLMESNLKDTIVNVENILLCDFRRANPKTYTMEDLQELNASSCMFARKFRGSHLDVVRALEERIKKNSND